MRVFAVLVMAGALLAGCTDGQGGDGGNGPEVPDDDAITVPASNATIVPVLPVKTVNASLPFEASLALTTGSTLRLGLGEGQGRITFTAVDGGRLPVRMEHDRIEDLDLFSDGGEGYYNLTEYTMVYLFKEDTFFFEGGNFYFTWWGTPTHSFWPSGSNFEEPSHDSLDLVAGANYTLLAVNTVPGYTLVLGAGVAVESKEWILGARQGFVFAAPDESRTALAEENNVHVDRVRLWNLPESERPTGLLIASAWSAIEDLSVYAGAGSRTIGFRSGESMPLPSTIGPLYSVAPNGGGSSKSTITGHLSEPASLELFFEMRETKVGIEGDAYGGGFLVIPD